MAVGLCWQTSENSTPPLIFLGDFETPATGTDRLGTADREAALSRTRLVTYPDLVRAGGHALQVTLDRAAGDHRTDFYVQDIGGRFRVGREYWYGFSVRFPEDWQPDRLNELFVQWVRSTARPMGPQLALYLNGEDYVLRKRWDPDPNDDVLEVEYKNVWRGPVLPDRGRWVDWVVHINWSKGDDGLVEVWKDGESVVRHVGPNMYNDGEDRAPYFKFGLYKWPWQKTPEEEPSPVTRRTLVFDEIRIGDASAGRAGVSPP